VVTIIPDRWTVRPSGAAHPPDQRPRRRDGPSPRYVGYLASSPAGLRRRSITHIRESQMTGTTTSSTISRNSGSCEMSTISPVRARDKPVQRRTEAREALRPIYHEVAGVLVDFVLHAVGRDDLNVGADNLGKALPRIDAVPRMGPIFERAIMAPQATANRRSRRCGS
jgi:hypothetical protein